MCIAIVCSPVCDAINFKIDLIFLIKPFFFKTKNTKQKIKNLENEKSFLDKTKSNVQHFQKTFSCQSLRPESAPLNQDSLMHQLELIYGTTNLLDTERPDFV